MTYLEAKRRVALKRLIGLGVITVCAIVTVISILKFIYFGLDEGGALFANLAFMLKRLVYAIYEKTQFLSLIWKKAPVIDQKLLFAHSNLWFFCWYLGVFIGLSIFRSANKLAVRLREIDRQIEDELIRESIRNGPRRTRKQVEEAVEIPRQVIWKEIHTLYMAPLVVGFILLILGKLLGLT